MTIEEKKSMSGTAVQIFLKKGNFKKAYGKNLYRNLSDDKVDDKSKTDLYFNQYES